MLLSLVVGSILVGGGMSFRLDLGSRILNGTESNTTAHPYQVSIEFNKNHRCSGTMLNAYWVLTVANCLANIDKEFFRVRAGAPMRGIMGEVRDVIFYMTHPEFDQETFDNDIAILKMNDAVLISNETNIIDVGERIPTEGTVVTVSGWGASSPGAWLSQTLFDRELTIVYFNDCKYAYNGVNNAITERMVCAGDVEGGPCQGDPGDPLIYNNEVIGLMSWSYGCGEKHFPAVFTDVTKFATWIKFNIRHTVIT